ncbi:MarR family transcriptional regulator [Leptospira kobayashii]|uniref:MarR family transcriptional regulator n=1 Tax=Leptospira kobayashii TaxID=1917830 RepID=A0ABN6KFE9_9LEPT|nr:MarR family transcriptional regulator [Leptospira kobayashii]BDA79828.1 MarR family transcriptional regulator [Leptospira kobayashii]
MMKLYRPLLTELNLTYPQYLVMLVLWEEDGLSVSEIGERLSLDSGTLTPLLKRMQTANLLERKRGEEDERVVTVMLTSAGKKLHTKALSVPEKLFCQLGISLQEVFSLKETLSRLGV